MPTIACRIAGLLPLLAIAGFSIASPTNHQSPLGINIRDVKYWGTEIPTVDLFKKAGANGRLWQTQSDTVWNTNEHAQLDVDAQGWVRSLPGPGSTAQYRYATTLLFWGSHDYPGGRYTVYYDGDGTLGYGAAGVRNAALSQPGVDIVDVTPANGGFYLSIRATDPNRTGNYLRNIRVIPPGGTCDHDPRSYTPDGAACPATFRPFTQTYASEPFHPLFLNDTMRFAAIRFIHFTGTNTTMVQDWSQRVQPNVASWGGQNADGAPYEAAIALANLQDASPWFNVPARASDDFVLRFAQLVKANLTTARPIYLEYNNETWNGSYPYSIHGQWMQANGVARWPSSPLDNFSKQMNWFGMRTAQVCAIWKQVFADQPGRVKCVMGSQLANSGVSTSALDCPLHVADGNAPCRANMDALAVGSYFGDYIAQSRFEPIWRSWFAEPDGGLQKLFDETTIGLIPRYGTPAVPMSALAGIRMQLGQQKAIASARNLELVAYEAGSGFDAASRPVGDPLYDSYQQLQTLMDRGSRDGRIEAVVREMLDDWKAAGGNLLMAFSSAQPWSAISGNAALYEYEGQPRSAAPKYDAVLGFIETTPCWWTGCDLGTQGVSTTINLAISPYPVVNRSSATLTATVTPLDARGVVTFLINGLSAPSCEQSPLNTVNGRREAACQLAGLTDGSYSVAAAYSGDSTHQHAEAWQTMTVAIGTGPGILTATPTTLDFGTQSMGTTSPAMTITMSNTGQSSLTVQSASTNSAEFLVTGHDCGDLVPGAICRINIAFAPAISSGAPQTTRTANGTLTAMSTVGSAMAGLQGVAEKSLVSHYYRSILRRAPDAGGANFWAGEATRLANLGLDPNETWYALARFFFDSTEYRQLARDDAGFVTDLYQAFFNRAPDAGGLAFWIGQLAAGLTREVALSAFMFSPEFGGFTQAIFGAVPVRPEVNAVTDFYRGLLARLPDDGGFGYWLTRFRTAQCSGAGAVSAAAEAISSQFATSPEYAARARSNAQYVGDLYNAFLRRGGDLEGVLYWINQIDTGARSREVVRQAFVGSPEFQGRVSAIASAPCLP